MKCPACGKESETGAICSKCGFKHPENMDKLEVEYKDFKTSELLEIRRMRQVFPGEDTRTDRKCGRSETKRSLPEGRKRGFPVAAMVLLLLVLISLSLFLFRHFLLK